MIEINNITRWILMLVAVGCTIRIVTCALQMAADPDEASTYKKRIKHAIMFAIIAVTAFGIKTAVVSYF
ncbi:MAG: hypothetical protein LBN34_03080 [Clostridiales Family XIII bacterium]|jgi:hypothetical protein|nr:hypothetical protein [Clostridiales Family XIII bacterium]